MENFKIGHYNNDYTGVSVVVCESGAVGGVCVRGGAPATRETDLLDSHKANNQVHAVVLSGGSAYGLEAHGGVMQALAKDGFGFKIANKIVPIVVGASVFDLIHSDLHFPTIEMGKNAYKNAKENNVICGQIGAGTSATIGKILGSNSAVKGGIGAVELKCGDAKLGVVVCVNALGDVFDSTSGKIVSGARNSDGSFLDTNALILSGKILQNSAGQNTTIGVIYTDAEITKTQANTLASIAHNGLALSIKPVHTMYDGDALFTLSCGNKKVDFTALSVCAIEAVRQAVLKAVL